MYRLALRNAFYENSFGKFPAKVRSVNYVEIRRVDLRIYIDNENSSTMYDKS